MQVIQVFGSLYERWITPKQEPLPQAITLHPRKYWWCFNFYKRKKFYRTTFRWLHVIIFKWKEIRFNFCYYYLRRALATYCSVWLVQKNLAPLFHPIRSKNRTSRDSLARVFPHLASATCTYFEFWLVTYIVCVFGDWLEWLLCFWFYYT